MERKERTRAALIESAQALLAEGRSEVPVLEIAARAGVGVGSFYNHFRTKEELFEAAVDAAAESYGAVLQGLAVGTTDPALVVAQSFRLTGRLHRLEPRLSKSLIERAPSYFARSGPLVRQIRHNIARGVAADRFRVGQLDLAVGTVFGALIMLGSWLHQNPEEDDAEAADLLVVDVLKFLGIAPDEAASIAREPLPDLSAHGSTAGVVDN